MVDRYTHCARCGLAVLIGRYTVSYYDWAVGFTQHFCSNRCLRMWKRGKEVKTNGHSFLQLRKDDDGA